MPAPDPRATVEAAQAAAVERLRAFGLPEAAAGKFAALAMAGALPVLIDGWRKEMRDSLAETAAALALATRVPIGDGTFTIHSHGRSLALTHDLCGGYVYHHDHDSVWLHRFNEEAARHTCPTEPEGTSG